MFTVRQVNKRSWWCSDFQQRIALDLLLNMRVLAVSIEMQYQ